MSILRSIIRRTLKSKSEDYIFLKPMIHGTCRLKQVYCKRDIYLWEFIRELRKKSYFAMAPLKLKKKRALWGNRDARLASESSRELDWEIITFSAFGSCSSPERNCTRCRRGTARVAWAAAVPRRPRPSLRGLSSLSTPFRLWPIVRKSLEGTWHLFPLIISLSGVETLFQTFRGSFNN